MNRRHEEPGMHRLATASRRPTERSVYVAEGDLGKGLFAARRIVRGEIILRFRGPVIDFDTAVAKGEWQCYPLQIGPSRYIDLLTPGCFANHSCDPNAGIVDNAVLTALSDINEGTEVRYDYSTTMDENFWTMPCRCGSSACRKTVADFGLLPLGTRERYLRLGIVQRFIAEQYRDQSGRIAVPQAIC